jgi:carbon monoxide dehydrogenase subunit G
VTETASATPETVYAVLSDVAGWATWAPGVKRAVLEHRGEPSPTGPGAIRKLGRPGFYVREKILATDPPHLQSYTLLSGLPVKDYRGDVELHPDGDATRIDWRGSFGVKVPGTGPILQRLLRSTIAKTASALAREAERKESAG